MWPPHRTDALELAHGRRMLHHPTVADRDRGGDGGHLLRRLVPRHNPRGTSPGHKEVRPVPDPEAQGGRWGASPSKLAGHPCEREPANAAGPRHGSRCWVLRRVWGVQRHGRCGPRAEWAGSWWWRCRCERQGEAELGCAGCPRRWCCRRLYCSCWGAKYCHERGARASCAVTPQRVAADDQGATACRAVYRRVLYHVVSRYPILR